MPAINVIQQLDVKTEGVEMKSSVSRTQEAPGDLESSSKSEQLGPWDQSGLGALCHRRCA